MQVPELGSNQAKNRALAEAAKKAAQEKAGQAPEMVMAKYAFYVALSDGSVAVYHDLEPVPNVDHATNVPDEMLGMVMVAQTREPTVTGTPDEAYTAFLIALTEDGRILVFNNLNTPVSVDHQASDDEVYMALAVVESDLISTKTALKAAQGTVQGMMNMGQQMAHAQAEQQANAAALAAAGLNG
jgi:hypothetical protein